MDILKKYVLTLPRSEDRQEKFKEHVKDKLDNWEFIDGVDGKEITHDNLVKTGMNTNPNWRDPFQNRKLTRGEIGCFLSHYNVWKKVAESNMAAIVFEDDAVIDFDIWDEKYYNELISKFDFIYLQRNENEPEKVKYIDGKIETPFYPYNLTAYVITPNAAKALISTRILQSIIPADEYVPLMVRDGNRIPTVALVEDSVTPRSRDEVGTNTEPTSEDDYIIDFRTHIVTVGTDQKKSEKLFDSSMVQHIYPLNLGKGVEWKGTDMSGPGGGMKLNLIREYIKDKQDSDVIVFTDAYDVFYADDMDTIIRRYLSFNTRTLFAAERYCWPNESIAEDFPEAETPYRYLNSGVFISEVGQLKKILNEPIEDDADDQLYLQKVFLSKKYDIKLDTEHYIFVTHEPEVVKSSEDQLLNPITNTCGCIYHGNGGVEAKNKFDALYRQFYPKFPTLYIPTFKNFDVIDRDMLIVNFMTQSQCEDLINIADKHGNWGSLNYDKFPAQEIRMKELGLFDELENHWKKNLYPIIEEYWRPILMYGLRDAFVMRYAMDTQTSLANHHDASLVTGSVKLNDDYEGAELIFHRQNISNKNIPVGRCILFPGQVTHGHECMELKSGVKYSLTMWSKRWHGDVGG